MTHPLSIVILGLSITSSWGNGHATTWRALSKGLAQRGHAVLFLERDVPWYAANRDLPRPPWCACALYRDLDELARHYAAAVRHADVVVVGSFVPEGAAALRWVLETARGLVAFYDIDTPVTVAALEAGDCAYLDRSAIPFLDLYLSFTGGPLLRHIERHFHARLARPLYCGVDPETHAPVGQPTHWDLGYLGTYSADRQAKLDSLLLAPAAAWPKGRFVVAGPQYPAGILWPENVARRIHLPPVEHRAFYGGQRFTLNLTRADMVAAGWSPSVRLFEAAACAVPILSDAWPGLEAVFEPGREVMVVDTPEAVLEALRNLPEPERRALGSAARRRVLAHHTAGRRAAEFEAHLAEAGGGALRMARA